MPESLDVIVIGAGFTGLSAALELKRRGLSFLLLEARGRVGGRVEARLNGLGEKIDTGGQFFCEDMPEVMGLARRQGMDFVETPVAGRFMTEPPASTAEIERVYAGARAIRNRMNAIDPRDPAIAGLSAAAWLARQDDAEAAKGAFLSMVEGLWCQPADEVPLWYLIDNDRRITNQTYELQYFPRQTMHALAEALAAELGADLRLGMPVRRIEHGSAGVRVAAGDAEFAGRRAVIALPPVMASRLAYAPALPARLARALAVWRSGAVMKLTLRYAKTFWREQGLSGMVMWRDIHGMFCCEVSRDDAHPALVVWIAGPLATDWRGLAADVFRAEVTGRLARALGKEALSPLDMLIRDWTDDPWSGGGYCDAVMDFEAYDAEDVIRRGAGPLGFASSELSPSFPGYVEGAIVMGRIAAAEAAGALTG